MRNKYEHIRAIIPQNAMSAATMIACACDEIYMGKHSAIGPIDPQIILNTQTGPFVAPVQSIIDEFERAKIEVKSDPMTASIWVRRIDKYPIGFLKVCENTIKLSKEKVEEWLRTWMLKSDANKEVKAKEIAEWLGNTNLHKTHGRPIDINKAIEKGLVVKFIEEDDMFQDKVMSVHHAALQTFEVTNCTKFIENHNGKGIFLRASVQMK
jgi:ClpP class serine protease